MLVESEFAHKRKSSGNKNILVSEPVASPPRESERIEALDQQKKDLADRAKTQILNGILDNIPVIVFRINSEGIFTEAHGCGLRRLGIVDPSVIVGSHVLDGYPDVKNELAKALSGETVVCESHGVVGDRPWWLQNYLFCDFVKGSGCIGFALDITDFKLAEQKREKLELQIQHAQKLKSLGIMAGGIAHDFNNLLMGILGNASLALKSEGASVAVIEYLKQIKSAAEKAGDICKSMLDFCGKNKFVREPLSLVSVVRDVESLLRASVPKKVWLDLSLDENTPYVEANASQIRQIIFNLVSNASDAIGDTPGVITLKTSEVQVDKEFLANTFINDDLQEGTYAQLEIADSGCGMDPEMLARVFDPFFTTKFTGRGLGLATVIGIVQNHQASIRCDSAPGKGTCFKIIFKTIDKPVEAHARSSMPCNPEISQAFAKGKTVLVVDDDIISQEVIAHMLEAAGYTIMIATDGQDGLEKFSAYQKAIDLVVLDLTMPKLSGDEALKRMRLMKPGLPILMSSAYDEESVESKFAGAEQKPSAFIQKPYEYDTLIDKVKQIL